MWEALIKLSEFVNKRHGREHNLLTTSLFVIYL